MNFLLIWLYIILNKKGLFVESFSKKSIELYKLFTKKENILFDREINRLERFFGGLADLPELPAALFVIDVKKEQAALREATKKGIPVIAVVDSNASPDAVDYIIPANDDAIGSVKLIVSTLADAMIQGTQIFEKNQKTEKTVKGDKIEAWTFPWTLLKNFELKLKPVL